MCGKGKGTRIGDRRKIMGKGTQVRQKYDRELLLLESDWDRCASGHDRKQTFKVVF